MPYIANTDAIRTRAANTILAKTFFPRAKKWMYPELASSYISTSEVEPIRVMGAVPVMKRYRGVLNSGGIATYSEDVPNVLFKNLIEIEQGDMEFDQTNTIMNLSGQIGQRLAELPDSLWAKRLIQGEVVKPGTSGSSATANLSTCVVSDYRGKNYNLTLDGLPIFSQLHPAYDGNSTISNVITRTSWPATRVTMQASDWGALALMMQQMLGQMLDQMARVRDNAGAQIYQSLEPEDSVIILVPRFLYPAAKLAFATKNSIIANGGSASGPTTNIAPSFVKKVISSGLLQGGFADPEPTNTGSQSGLVGQNSTATASTALYLDGGTISSSGTVGNVSTTARDLCTTWYAAIVNDFVKPFYVQIFRPVKNDEMFPRGYDPMSEVKRIMKENGAISVEEATLFASTRIDSTFRRIGADADLATIRDERFAVSARYRGNIAYGPWFTLWKFGAELTS